MSIPYIGFSNATLEKLPLVGAGEEIDCPHCQGKHRLRAGKSETAAHAHDMLLFFTCGQDNYLGAVANRLVIGVKADISGTYP